MGKEFDLFLKTGVEISLFNKECPPKVYIQAFGFNEQQNGHIWSK